MSVVMDVVLLLGDIWKWGMLQQQKVLFEIEQWKAFLGNCFIRLGAPDLLEARYKLKILLTI